MKLGKDVLLEIVDIVRDGILNNKDMSERLRSLDLDVVHGIPAVEGGANPNAGTLKLSDEYVKQNPRGGDWS